MMFTYHLQRSGSIWRLACKAGMSRSPLSPCILRASPLCVVSLCDSWTMGTNFLWDSSELSNAAKGGRICKSS